MCEYWDNLVPWVNVIIKICLNDTLVGYSVSSVTLSLNCYGEENTTYFMPAISLTIHIQLLNPGCANQNWCHGAGKGMENSNASLPSIFLA